MKKMMLACPDQSAEPIDIFSRIVSPVGDRGSKVARKQCTPPAAALIEGSRDELPMNPSGVLVLDKPEGRTSFSVVHEIKNLLGVGKAGHCGTLDPFATGVFLLCLNQATRIADQLLEHDKVYRFTVCFGFKSDTLDRTGRIVPVYNGPPPSAAALQRAMDCFRGPYVQQVPRYAAVKVQGRRLYALARKGIEIELPQRQVHIYSLELVSYLWPEAVMEVRCSKGTYIRQLAADLGHELQCGAYVSELRRLASGPFAHDQAMSLEELHSGLSNGDWQERLIRMSDVLSHLPVLAIADTATQKRLLNGHLDLNLELDLQRRFQQQSVPVRLVTAANNDLIALWWPLENGNNQHRLRVFGAHNKG
jgi:tRNA pseudouridine55 synthase